MPIELGFHIQNCKRFLEYFGFYLFDYSLYEKNSNRIFFICLFPKLQRQKINFVFKSSGVKPQHVSFRNDPFLGKVLISLFIDLIFFYTLKKNLVEKLGKIMEMERKTYTPVGTWFIFQKTKFNVLAYIQHDFICQHE